MEFRYYYTTAVDGEIKTDEFGHIKIWGKPTTFLCGAEKPDNYKVKEWVEPGRPLCKACLQERKRLVDSRPTPENLITWWQGGQAAQKKEMEALR